MASNPYPKGSPEWQAWLNERIAEHDEQVAKQNNENQNFEIAPPHEDDQ